MADSPVGAMQCLKRAGARSVWLVDRDPGPPQVVKTWPLTPRIALEALVGGSPAHRQHRGWSLTSAAGIATPDVTVAPRLAWRGSVPVVEMAHDYVPGEELFRRLERDLPDAGEQVRIGRACGAIVARYAEAGLFHRDLKLSNLVIATADGAPWVVDTLGVRRMRRPAPEIARMLGRLWVEAAERALPVDRGAVRAALRAGLRPLRRETRRAVFARLRARPRP